VRGRPSLHQIIFMATSKVSPDQDSIHVEVHIAAPPERVFQAVTDPRQLSNGGGSEGCITTSIGRAIFVPAASGDLTG